MKPDLSRRDFLKAAVLAPLLPTFLAACRRADTRRIVNFFNWSNYIGKDTLPNFTKRTGVEVHYDLFADEEEMFAKLRAGARGYDLIVVGDYLIPRFRMLEPDRPDAARRSEEHRQYRPALPPRQLRSRGNDGSLSLGNDRNRVQPQEDKKGSDVVVGFMGSEI